MAQRVQIIRVSDLSGQELGEGGHTVEFSYEGVAYQLDLSDKEKAAFDKVMAPYVENGTRIGGRRKSGGGGSRKSSETAKIKEWADANGKDYPKRGRLPQSLVDEYKAATGG